MTFCISFIGLFSSFGISFTSFCRRSSISFLHFIFSGFNFSFFLSLHYSISSLFFYRLYFNPNIYIYIYICICVSRFVCVHIYLWCYIYIYIKMSGSMKRFVFFRIYLFILFLHTCMFQLDAFIREYVWHEALLMGYSMRLELTRVHSLNVFIANISVVKRGPVIVGGFDCFSLISV